MGAPSSNQTENWPCQILGFEKDGNRKGQPICGPRLAINVIVTQRDGSELEGIFKCHEAQLINVEVDARNGMYDLETRRFSHIYVRTVRENGEAQWNEITAFYEPDLRSQYGYDSPQYRKRTRWVPKEGIEIGEGKDIPPLPVHRQHRGDYGQPAQSAAKQTILRELVAEGTVTLRDADTPKEQQISVHKSHAQKERAKIVAAEPK